jgi:O-antigen ligase
MPAVIALAAVLVPLLLTPGLLFYYDVTPKLLAVLFLCAAALLFSRRRAPRLRGRLPGILLIQAAALVLATAFSTHVALSFSGGVWRRFGAVAQLALLAFTFLAYPHLRDIAALARGVIASGGAIALYSIFQYFGVDPLLPGATYRAGAGEFTIVRPPGTLGHADYLAGYLLFVVFAAVYVARRDGVRGWRVAGVCVGGLCLLGLVMSGTRAGVVGLVAGGVWMGLREAELRRRKVVLFCAIVSVTGIVISSGFVHTNLGRPLLARLHWIREDPAGGARLLLWRDSLRMAAARPLSGFGPDTFGAEFPQFQSVELARAYPDFYHESAHNVFLDFETEQGLFGLAAFAALVSFGVRAAWRASTPEAKFGGAAFVAMFVSLQFAAFTLATAFFFYLALAIAAAGEGRTEEARVGWRVAAVALAAVFVWFGARLGVSDGLAARMDAAIARRDWQAAIREEELARRWAPPAVSYDLYYARAMARASVSARSNLAAAQLGREAYDAAVRACGAAEQRQNALYNLAMFDASRNDAEGTERSLRAAIEAAPNWFKPHWTLARLLALQGHSEPARQEALIAMDLDGGRDAEVRQTLEPIIARAN